MRRIRPTWSLTSPDVLAVFRREPGDPAIRAHMSFNEGEPQRWRWPDVGFYTAMHHSTPGDGGGSRWDSWDVQFVFSNGIVGIARSQDLDAALLESGLREVRNATDTGVLGEVDAERSEDRRSVGRVYRPRARRRL